MSSEQNERDGDGAQSSQSSNSSTTADPKFEVSFGQYSESACIGCFAERDSWRFNVKGFGTDCLLDYKRKSTIVWLDPDPLLRDIGHLSPTDQQFLHVCYADPAAHNGGVSILPANLIASILTELQGLGYRISEIDEQLAAEPNGRLHLMMTYTLRHKPEHIAVQIEN